MKYKWGVLFQISFSDFNKDQVEIDFSWSEHIRLRISQHFITRIIVYFEQISRNGIFPLRNEDEIKFVTLNNALLESNHLVNTLQSWRNHFA